MIEFFFQFNTIMIFVMIGLFIALSALMSGLKAQRDMARRECERLSQELSKAKSAGGELAQKVGWRKKRLMNKPEFALYRELHGLVGQSGAGHRLFAQVAFGAFLEATARADLEEIKSAAFYAVQRKVADFLIIDRYGQPVAVIEYQGSGHFLGNAHDRDHAKRIVCKFSGLPYIEVPASGLTHGQRGDLHRLLGIPTQLAAE
ncbi:DUF2726 domain-containing protein [Roseicyclus mahoneyensis]|uniref:Uncharacterized protein DUF2726 n=1 Tax=Roseicyclus mahoneyensis TaxID=164332 RepID=A0A316GH85_9RHOB|nr:DUF2726 domain-containing protein [Roseicyclus mahoneyensis]PWK59537.1 uncharacterized protein DUF2726 [Roseicyclus mahoneyensis]